MQHPSHNMKKLTFLTLILLFMAACQAPVEPEYQAGRTISTVGEVIPLRYTDLSFTTGGIVLELLAGPGDEVGTGQPLIQLDTTETEQKLALKESELAKAEVALNQAQANLQAAQALQSQLAGVAGSEVGDLLGFQADSAITEAQNKVDEAQATVDGKNVEVTLLQIALEGMTLRSPFEGVLVKLEAEVGEQVPPAAPVATVADVSQWLVEAPVVEADIAAIAVGDAAEMSLTALPGTVFFGQVIRISTTAIELPPPEGSSEPIKAFVATLELANEPAVPLRWGMTLSLDIGGDIKLPGPPTPGPSPTP